MKSNTKCTNSKTIEFTTVVLKSGLYDFRDSYIVLKGAITATGYKAVIFKNYSLVINCITETNKSQIDES